MNFKEGGLPFRYLRVPMTSEKFVVKDYIILIDKIVGRVTHWNSRLLGYARQIQLLKSITFTVMNYWVQALPFPKVVIQKIEIICHTIMWTCDTKKSRKSPITWKTICSPKSHGLLNMIDLNV